MSQLSQRAELIKQSGLSHNELEEELERADLLYEKLKKDLIVDNL